MAELFVRNSLNSFKAVKFNLSLDEFVSKDSYGENVWVLTIGTLNPDISGNTITPVVIHNVSEGSVEDEVAKAVESMCTLIDWTTLEIDNDSPYIEDFRPEGQNVILGSNIEIQIKDALPSSGIDLSDVKVILNNGEVDFDITSELEITGDPYDYKLTWISKPN